MLNGKLIQAYWLGSVDYDTAWLMQSRLADQVALGKIPPTLLLLEHPHVVTIGRRGGREHILWNAEEMERHGVQVREVDRGGDVTYHGPGQLVGYPILPLAAPGWTGERLPQADFTGYLRRLEEALIHLLACLGIAAGQREGLTGVWIMADVWGRCPRCIPSLKPSPAKIASIGVKVDAKGITRHGFALNVNPQMDYWESIIPCGLDGVQMACVADFVEPPSMPDLARQAASELSSSLEVDVEWKAGELPIEIPEN